MTGSAPQACGCPWPGEVKVAKAAFIAKPTTSWDQPLSLRILLILTMIYKTWAKYRLQVMAPWIQCWATQDMLAIAESADAALAFLRSALL